MEMVETRLREIEALEDGWDGYGATSIPKEVMKNTRTFIKTLGINLAPDDITPTPYGSIEIDLERVSIEIGIKQIGWFEYDGPNLSKGIDTDFLTIPEQLKELI